LTSLSFARSRFEIVMRLTQNRPPLDVAQMCVKPRKPDVSGLPSPRAFRCRAGARARSSQDYRLGVPWAARPLSRRAGGYGLSRFSRMEVPHMPWFSDRAGPADGSC